MKIYPCDHDIKIKKQVDFGDIPLSYLQDNEENKEITIQILNEFTNPYQAQNVCPYQTFENKDFLLFDQDLQPVDPLKYLVHKGANYYIRPLNVVSESVVHASEKFTYSVLLQKQDTYKKSVTYDIALNVADNEMAEAMMRICCDNDKKKIYPTNILFNHNTNLKNDLINQDIATADFMFSSLTDITTQARDNLNMSLSSYLNQLLSEKHTNLWLTDDSFAYSYSTDDVTVKDTDYAVKSPQVFASVSGSVIFEEEELPGRFYTTKKWDLMSEDTDEYIEFFSAGAPVQIIHRKNGGYVILSHPSIITNSSQYRKMIIEVLMYVYLNTYYNTKTYSSFVTDDPIDYFININQKYGLCHPQINLVRILTGEQFNIKIQYSISTVTVSQNASYTGVTRFQDLLFKKVSARLKDRSKGNNILAYTSNKTLLVYAKNDTVLQTVESGVEIRNNGDMTLTIDPVYSSKHKIVSESAQTIPVPPDIKEYYLVYDEDEARKFVIVEPGKIGDRIEVALIKVEDNLEIRYRDIRVPGGGEWSKTPNYEMIDTGNLNGRPLRYGSIMIIQLPSRLKEIKAELQSEIEKHMTSGDYPILVFKD